MSVREAAFLFGCEGDELVGVVSVPALRSNAIGVLIVVGGPQYRVGSHRQFVLLARSLAENGIPCMRFDYRGMGDATGEHRGFEDVDADLCCAVDAFLSHVTSVRKVVLWGLCDGASAACMYLPRDERVGGVVLLNPWVRSTETEERAEVRHYYGKRFRDPAFWRKLLAGRVAVRASVSAYAAKVLRLLGWRFRRSFTSDVQHRAQGFRERFTTALAGFDGPVLINLSGRDLVAAEFRDYVRDDAQLASWFRAPKTRCVEFPKADHTFSKRALRRAVEEVTLDWVNALNKRGK